MTPHERNEVPGGCDVYRRGETRCGRDSHWLAWKGVVGKRLNPTGKAAVALCLDHMAVVFGRLVGG